MPFPRLQDAGCLLIGLALLAVATESAVAQPPRNLEHSAAPRPAPAIPLGLAPSDPATAPIDIEAAFATQFEHQGEQVRILRGRCVVRQGNRTWTAPQAVVWESPGPLGTLRPVWIYLEGNPDSPALSQGSQQRESAHSFLVDLETISDLRIRSQTGQAAAPPLEDPLYLRALDRRHESPGGARLVQYAQAQGGQNFVPPAPYSPYRRRVSISPRFLGDRLQWKAELSEATIPPEYIITVTGGVNIVVDNVPLVVNGQTILTRIDLTADRAVVWTDASKMGDFSSFEIDESTPFQVYLEGNIIVRQGTNTVRASHAFYDIPQRRGMLMNAEIRSFLSDYQGTLRLRATELRQYSETNYHARNAFFTTSEFGYPKYRIQASDVFVQEVSGPGTTSVNPQTGQRTPGSLWVTSRNNRVFLGDFPVFYTPYLSAAAEDPHIPIRKFNFGYSGMFGGELETVFNLDSLFGWDLPRGMDWDLQLDYFTKRGPAVGTRLEYDVNSDLFGLPLHNKGFGLAYYLHDDGVDNLGLNRRALVPIDENRGRLLLRHRSEVSPFTYAIGEVGHIFNNDRNFMEQYYEPEWDTGKDLENLLYLHHQQDNFTASLLASARTNDFENQTSWLPKADLTILGEPVFGSPVLWSSHSSVGYGQLRQADPPPNPLVDPFMPLPYFADSQGTVAMSRHELSLPFNVGPVNVAPYVLGEVAHWQEDLLGDELTRLYGAAGVRASIQFSKYMPQVANPLLGLNGLAHKVIFDVDYSYASSSENLSSIPQYNEFDDNAQERFRERFLPIEFGGVLPAIYDPRFYAVRSGAGRAVTAPYHELVDDQQVAWLGMRHRWQTKVGPPQQQRIIDWMELDLGTALFPDANQDNFGETFGLATGRYAWHVSPRTSLLANGIVDVFADGQKVWNVGVLSQRSARGSIYLGYREVQVGPIDSQLLTGSFTYVMSPNLYVATFGSSFDIAEGIDRGQSLTITRIGESFLLHFGIGFDRSRDNVGVALSFEPKFGSFGGGSTQLNSLLGIQ